MKRVILCLALVLIAAQALAQGKFLTEHRGLSFGKEISDFQYMRKVRSQGVLDIYTRYGDDRQFQGVPLTEHYYGLYQKKLCLVMFSAKGPSAYSTLKAYFDATYGQPSQPKVNVKQYVYSAGDVDIEMRYSDDSKILEISYVYRPIMRQLGTAK